MNGETCVAQECAGLQTGDLDQVRDLTLWRLAAGDAVLLHIQHQLLPTGLQGGWDSAPGIPRLTTGDTEDAVAWDVDHRRRNRGHLRGDNGRCYGLFLCFGRGCCLS